MAVKKQPKQNSKKGSKPVKKTAVGRKCSVCTHEKVDEINQQITRSASFRDISRQFFGDATAKDSVYRHVNNCLKIDMSAMVAGNHIKQVVNHYEELRKQLEFVKDLQKAAIEILTDDRTGKISLQPRAENFTVVYLDHNDINSLTLQPKRKSENLQTLLDEINGNSNYDVLKFSTNYTEAKNYALHTVKAIDDLLDKVAKVDNHYFKEKESIDADLEMLKDKITKRAQEKGVGFHEELKNYLSLFADKLHPQIKSILNSELVTNAPEITEVVQ